jgi:hypothetical protein
VGASVPVSPFEERLAAANRDVNTEDSYKLTSDVKAGKSTTNDNTTIIVGGQRRKVPFRSFRI